MEKDVTRHIEEQLSAFLDGELPEQELALLVRRLERDESHRATLDRYVLISSAMRDEPTPDALRLRQGVMAALDGEQPPLAQPATAAAVKRPVYGAAAAFALIAVAGALLVARNVGMQPGVDPAVQTPAIAADVSVTPPPARVTAESAPTVVAATAPALTSPLRAKAPLTAVALQPAEAPAAALSRERQRSDFERLRQHRARMRSYLISHGEYSRPFQGAMADSRMYVQQASFEE